MKLDNSKKILIIGLGLIGGSYADALTKNGYEVGAIEPNEKSLAYALSHCLISHGRVDVDSDYIGRFDLVVFALYPHILIEWIEKNQKYLKNGAVLTDVTGVKGCVVYKIQSILREGIEFIGAHPMAGREKSGIEAADGSIFRGANYIVTPTEKNSERAVRLCSSLGETLGFERITELSPEKHDEMIAFLSQLTHCIAVSLMTSRDTSSLADYTGDSFRDLTRIAKINDEMWSELFIDNKDELLRQMNAFEDAFNKLKQTIEDCDRDAMREIMRRSTEQRILFDRKEVKPL